MNVRKLKILLALFSFILVYQNCGGDFNANGEGVVYASLSSCEAGTQALFESTFYPFTTQNCVACHTSAGPGQGDFADPDVASAYQAFVLLGATTVASYATNAGHAPPHTGPQNNAAMTPILSTWQTTTNCSSTGQSSGVIATSSQVMNLTTNGPNYGVGTAETISWNLATDVSGISGMIGTLQIQVYVDVHSISPGNNSYNYVFINPTIINNTASNIQVTGLHVWVNGTLAGTVTAYNDLNVVLPQNNTTTLLSAIGDPFIQAIAPTDTVSIYFDGLSNTTATATTGLPTN